MTGVAGEPMVRHDGTYPTVPLRSDTINVAVVQTRVFGVNGDNPAPDLQSNVDYFIECIDAAQGYGGRADLLVFHEFPITGFRRWTREQHYRLAIEVNGPEVARVCARAKQHNCYIAFGTYAKDPVNWPDHILHLMILAGPDGKVRATHWKQRSVRGMFPGSEQYTTTIYDAYDRFVEMYGEDAVIPVERTDIGNIAMSAVQFEPELFRCMAIKGAEIIARTATGGFEYDDMKLTSYHNSLYTLICNNSINVGRRGTGFLEDTNYGGPGRSAIFGPRGIELAVAGPFETRRMVQINMKDFRAKHRIPDVHMTLYKPVFDQYRERYDRGLWLKELPKDGADAFRIFKGNSRWTHYW